MIASQYPSHRNVVLRLLEPLGAPEEDVSPASVRVRSLGPRRRPEGAARRRHSAFEGVSVRAGRPRHPRRHRPRHRAGRARRHRRPLRRRQVDAWSASCSAGTGRPPDGSSWMASRSTANGSPRLRRATAWVDPAVQLWNRSLLDNLRYGASRRLAAAGEAVIEAVRLANLAAVLRKLPQGLQTPLGEGGGLVSGGEGQRVRLARGLLRPGVRLVILDEPFRGLDREQRRRAAGARPPALAGRDPALHHPRRRRDARLRARAGRGGRPHRRGRRSGGPGGAAGLALPAPCSTLNRTCARGCGRAPSGAGSHGATAVSASDLGEER